MYVLGCAPCINCKQVFSFNPMRVPSVIIKGTREPICKDCVPRINELRRTLKLPLIIPFPDAYEGCDEAELYD
jgi:hypothetical protein